MMQKLLIIGGKPSGTMDILRYAKSKGVYTIVCDYIKREQSETKQLADESWDISTDQIDAIVSKAKEAKVMAVFTGIHEFNIARTQEICEKLELPFYATRDNIKTTCNKRIYKDIFAGLQIPVIPEYKISDLTDIPDEIEYPILLKPLDGTGAYGLQICNSKQDVINKVGSSLAHSQAKEIMAEKYILDKEEITTVYIIKDGEPHLAGVADRVVKHFNDGIIPLPVAYIWNSKYLDLYEKNIDGKMKRAIKAMNLKNGMLFVQSIVKDNVILPYDLGFRLSGTQEHIIFEAVCGYNPLNLLVDYALSGKFGDDNLVAKINPHFKHPAAQITFLVHPATIKEFVGIEEVLQLPGVIRVIKNKTEGETIPDSALGTLNQIALRVYVKANDESSLKSLIDNIRKKIKITSDTSKNILI